MSRRLASVAAAVVLVLLGGVAFAAWLSTGSGAVEAAATTVLQANAPSATASGTTVSLSWPPSKLANDAAVDSYDVLRHEGASVITVCAQVTTTACTDPSPASGSVRYGVVARKGSGWTGVESPLSSPLTFDTAGPTVTVQPSSSSAWRQVATQLVQIDATDAGSGLASVDYSIDGVAQPTSTSSPVTFTLGQGDHTITYSAKDYAGNATTGTSTVRVDNLGPSVNPTVSPAPNGSNGWYVGTASPTVTLSPTDGVSQVKTTEYQLNSTSGPWQSYPSGGITDLPDGNNTVHFRVTDNAGNVTTDSRTVKIDRTAPGGGATPDRLPNANGWYKADVTLTLNASDDGGSGVASVEYQSRLDLGSFSAFKPYDPAKPLVISADGTTNVNVRTTDNAGNTFLITNAAIVKLDKTAPTSAGSASVTGGTLNSATGWYTAAPKVSFAGGADATSGIDSYVFALASGSFTSFSSAVTVADTAGPLKWYSQDKAGNQSAQSSTTLQVDTAAPAISGIKPANGSTFNGNGATVWSAPTCNGAICATVTDGTSGVASSSYQLTATAGSTTSCWNGTDFVTTTCSAQPMSAGVGANSTLWTANSTIPQSKLQTGTMRTYRLVITSLDSAGNSKVDNSVSFTAK